MKTFIYYFVQSLFLLVTLSTCTQQTKNGFENVVYQTDGEWIKGYNLDRYNNRPLYINNGNGFILTGDKPLIRLLLNDKLLGNLIISIRKGEEIVNLFDFDRIISLYAPGQMKWELNDSRLKNCNLTLNVLPAASGTGMVVRIETKKIGAGLVLNWNFGGGKHYPNKNLPWEFDVMTHPGLIEWKEFGNTDENSLFQGELHKEKTGVLTLSFKLDSNGELNCQTGEEANLDYRKAQHQLELIVGRMKINTPDPYLNMAAKSSVFAVDGTWYPPFFVHGCMSWNSPYLGWRNAFGATMYGWHDRILEQARYYMATQLKESDKHMPKADPAGLMTIQHTDSRYYGKGRINSNQYFYNMQTQFFDQLVEDYRWTSDQELVKVLREALELHLEWLRDCFDPDGDGVYESYINTWPTDSQWYNGGGAAEETSYAYRGHLAARDMARNAGDKESEMFHNQMLEKIRKGFFDQLWITGKGHSGSYREQGGHNRLHENPWLYSIFLPIDAGLTSFLQSIESVYYTEWALQNDSMPGGRMVWTSNWTPGIWSIRERYPGENYALALSYFQAGLPEDGMDIMKGAFVYTAFDNLVPGNLGTGTDQGGADFTDCIHTFCRTLVTGLFGFMPDYPNGSVKIAPSFPKDWEYASIELPDVKISFKRKTHNSAYSFELPQKTDMLLKLPVQTGEIKNVTLNGKKTIWEVEPGVGCTMVVLKVKDNNKATITIDYTDNLPYCEPVFMEGNAGDEITLTAKGAQIISFEDPQKVLENGHIHNGILNARLTDNKGYHTVTAAVKTGNNPQYRVFRIKINNPESDTKEAERYVEKIPDKTTWETIDISTLYNEDIKTIYKQQYLSPRPNTVSVRLGTDGYSPWTFPFWKLEPPEIKTDNVIKMLTNDNRLVTPQAVPFLWGTAGNNIAFTSMWDNYPAKIDFPVNKKGDAVFFLISGSTNVMQCQIANAVIRLNYTDGITDSLELVPPVNYWNLCPIYRKDYTSEIDKFVLPDKLPETVQLGENCRAMLLNLKLRKGVELKRITLETLSQEVVVGLIGVTIMHDL